MNKAAQAFVKRGTELLTTAELTGAIRLRRRVLETTEKAPWSRLMDGALDHTLSAVEKDLLPQLLRLRTKSLIPPGLVEILGRSWVGRFIAEASASKRSVPALARKYAKLLLAEGTVPHFTERHVIPLVNFSAARKFTLSGTVGRMSYKLRFMPYPAVRDPAELGFHAFAEPLDRAHEVRGYLGWVSDWVAVLDFVREKNRKSYPSQNTHLTASFDDGLITALRLFQDGDVDGPLRIYSRSLLYLSGGRSLMYSRQRTGPGKQYVLDESGIKRFQRLWKWFNAYIPVVDRTPPRIGLAISYYDSSYSKPLLAKFLDLHIGLESLFNIRFEQTYRLPIQVAALLGRTKGEALDLFDKVRGLWKVRNKIAHGDKTCRSPKFQKEAQDRIPELRSLLREAILRHFKLLDDAAGNPDTYEATVGENFEREFVVGRGLPDT